MTVTRKQIVALAILVVVACIAVRSAFVQGLFRPVRIAGGSMVDSLLGPHFELACRDCGLAVRYDADYPPEDDRVVCPNCGCLNQKLDRATQHGGQRVLLDRLAFRWRQPRRWEWAAFRTRGADEFFAVKRIVGLPGEHISIFRGDVYADDKIQRKSLEQLRAMAILVHDNAHPTDPNRGLPSRWRARTSPSGWRQCGDGFRFDPQFSRSDEIDRIEYHHWRCVDSPAPRTEECPVLDNYGYNQEVSRQLHRVTDLLLVCNGQVDAKAGELSLEAHDGREWFRVQLCFESRVADLHQGKHRLATTSLPYAAYARGVQIELAMCDRQVIFAIDRRVVLYCPYEVDGDATASTARPLRIGAKGVSASIRQLKVFRDLHYIGPRGLGSDWSAPRPLGDDELFVIGDNVPISRDSRHWTPFGVPEERLLGRVLQGP